MRAARALLFLCALPSSAMAANIFCCNDERGKQICSDLLPAVCVGRAYREINQSGMVVRIVEAPLTPEMRALKEQEERRKKEAEDAAKEQRRLDMALLQTYGSEADIDLMRKRAEADVVKSIEVAMSKIEDAKKRRKKFEDEAEFYKKRTLPPEVEKGLKDADYEITAQEDLIARKQKEMELIKAKYDEDKRRYLGLKNRPRSP